MIPLIGGRPSNSTVYIFQSTDASEWTNNDTTDSSNTVTASNTTGRHDISMNNLAEVIDNEVRLQVTITAGTHNYIYLGVYGDFNDNFIGVYDLDAGTVSETHEETAKGGSGVSSTDITDNGGGSWTLELVGLTSDDGGPTTTGVFIGLAEASTGNAFHSQFGYVEYSAAGTETFVLVSADLSYA